jgi:hypothetical protein
MGVTKSENSIVRKNSTGSDFRRRRLNFVEGSNITLTVADDSTDNEVDVTIAAAATAPGGSNTYVQFNDSSAFGGDDGLVFNKTNNRLGINGATLNAPLAIKSAGGSGVVILQSSSGSVETLGLKADTTSAAGNHILVEAGNGTDGIGGNATLHAGNASVSGGAGGDAIIRPGKGSGGSDGVVALQQGATAARKAILDISNLASTDKTFTFPNTTGTLALTDNPTDITVPDEAYDATAWDASLEVPTKNAVRDKIESLLVGSSDSFKTIAVSGQDDVIADSSTDTLTLVAGSNVTITTDDTTDTITIAASSSGGIAESLALAYAVAL